MKLAETASEGLNMGSTRIALIVAALLCATSLGGFVLQPSTKAADTRQAIVLENIVPRSFGGWRQEDMPVAQVVNPETKKLLDKLYSQILTRSYVNSAGQRIMLSIAYGSDQRDEFQAHKPEICYPAQGFTVHSNIATTLSTAFGSIPIRRLSTSMGSRAEPVTYWFTVGDQAIENKAYKRLVELRFALTGLIPDGLLFRVSSIDPDPEHAYQVQDDFVTQLLRTVPSDVRQRLSGLGNA